MLSKLDFKKEFKKELESCGMAYMWNHSTYYNKFVKLYKQGLTYDMSSFVREYYIQPLSQIIETKSVALAPLPMAVPASPKLNGCKANWTIIDDCIKKEGKTPMRYNDNYASASVQTVTPKSDAQVGREYLLNRLEAADYPKRSSFEKMFNLHTSNEPKNFQDLIDRIKNDKFKINKKVQKLINQYKEDADEAGADSFPWYHSSTYGIEWEGPKADLAGYEQALQDCETENVKARDIIMGSVYADGLKALQDFEAWLPTPATTIQ